VGQWDGWEEMHMTAIGLSSSLDWKAARRHSRTLQMGEENIQKMSMTRRVTKVVEWAIKKDQRNE